MMCVCVCVPSAASAVFSVSEQLCVGCSGIWSLSIGFSHFFLSMEGAQVDARSVARRQSEISLLFHVFHHVFSFYSFLFWAIFLFSTCCTVQSTLDMRRCAVRFRTRHIWNHLNTRYNKGISTFLQVSNVPLRCTEISITHFLPSYFFVFSFFRRESQTNE